MAKKIDPPVFNSKNINDWLGVAE